MIIPINRPPEQINLPIHSLEAEAAENQGLAVKESWQQRADTLQKLLLISETNSKATISDFIAEEFFREFAEESSIAITWAFREHWRVSRFLPAISEIRELVDLYKQALSEKRRMDAEERERKRLEQAQKDGKFVGLQGLHALFKEFAERQPITSTQLPLRIPAPIEFWTDEQIGNRKNELRRALQEHLAQKKPQQNVETGIEKARQLGV